jgi:HlyD family secretion protein
LFKTGDRVPVKIKLFKNKPKVTGPGKRRKLWIFLLLILLIGGSVGFYVAKNREKVTEVQVGKVNRQRLVSIVSASGEIQPRKKVEISASIAGKVIRLGVKEGDQVKKDDFLLQLDPIPFQAALNNANAALSAARAELDSAMSSMKQADQTYRRKKKMFEEQGLISQQEFEQSKTDYDVQQSRVNSATHLVEQSKARVEAAQDDLNKTIVTAPMAGTIVQLAVEEGEVAVIGTMNNPGTVLLTIADLSVMEADLEVDEADIGTLEIGQAATVTVDAFPGKKFSGTVTEIGNSPIQKTTSTNQEATDFKVTVTLNAPDVYLRPGLTSDGEITTAVRESCLTVPIQALVVRDISKENQNLPKDEREKEGVFLMTNGTAAFRPVKTGIMGEMNIEIVNGLKEGEQIVTGTFQTLRELKDGEKVEIAKEEPKAKAL